MTVVLVPSKGLQGAKTRLSSMLSPQQRSLLTTDMLQAVLSAARNCSSVSRVIVVGAHPDTIDLARQAEAEWMAEAPSHAGDLRAIIDQSIATLREQTSDSLLVLMADLPCVCVQDVNKLVEALQQNDVVLAPDRHRSGTNALGLAKGVQLTTCFGRSDSYQAHLDRIKSSGLSSTTVVTSGLELDIDTEMDFRDYVAARNSAAVVSRR